MPTTELDHVTGVQGYQLRQGQIDPFVARSNSIMRTLMEELLSSWSTIISAQIRDKKHNIPESSMTLPLTTPSNGLESSSVRFSIVSCCQKLFKRSDVSCKACWVGSSSFLVSDAPRTRCFALFIPSYQLEDSDLKTFLDFQHFSQISAIARSSLLRILLDSIMSRLGPTGLVVETVSPAELYDVISGAASQDPTQVRESTKRLKEMLEMFGTFDGLHEIAAQRTVPLPIRQQSIIQFKNAALNHWKSRKVLSDEHRVRIRARCLTFVDEEDEIIAECNQVIVSKISRQDFPHNWPSLITDLINAVDANLQRRYASLDEDSRETLILRRSLKLLNAILKEFSSYKMLNGVRIMTQIFEQLHLVLYGYYSKISSNFSSSPAVAQIISSPRVYNDILLAHLVYKCISKMATWLWNRIDKTGKEELEMNQAWLQELFQNSAIQLKTLIELRSVVIVSLRQTGLTADPHAHRSVDILTRHVRLFGKFFRRLQQLSHSRFVALPMCSDLILYYWSQIVEATNGPPEMIADSNDVLFPVRFLVQAMVLFKENLAQWSPVRRDGTPNKNSLSQDFIENAVRLLVTRFMPLNPSDLESWMADPEEWVNLEDKEDEQWEFEIRSCSERVLMQLSNQYTSYVTPLLEATFKQVAAQPSVDLPSIIQKEALYCAIGRCAIRLKDVIPFDQWLAHTLVAEARDTNLNYPLIKRRIAWVIGKWVGDSCTSPNNPNIWQVLVHLLRDRGPGTDAVVRLTAAVALRECVDTIDFNADIFAPFLPSAVAELVRIIGEADTLESKRRISKSLNTVIERAEKRIVPFISTITQPLPQLWTAAGEDWLFKASLLVTVTKLIDSVKEQSTSLSNIVVPLVRESLSPGVIIHLDEDALILWLTALRNTATTQSINGVPALFDLFPLAMSLLATNLDLLGKTINIVESYFLLDGPRILQAYAVDLFRAFHAALKSDAVTLNMKDMIIALNLLVQIAPASLWGEAMHISGLFAHLLKTLIDGESGTTLLTEQIYLLSRMVMSDRQIFLQLMSATASSQSLNETQLYEGLLDQWWGKFDHMSEPRHRKLTAMGITSLVSTGRPEVLHRLPGEIFNLWLDVFGEIKEAQLNAVANEDGSSPIISPLNLRRHWELDEAPRHYYQNTEGSPEYSRRKAVYDQDPVRTMQLSAYVAAHLREAEASCGSQEFQLKYLAKADPTVLKQIQDELSRG